MTVFTICSMNYLPRAIVAVESFRNHNKIDDAVIVMCERKSVPIPDVPGIRIVSMFDIELPADPIHMAYQYDVLELNTSVKPFVFMKLFRDGADAATYIDPDTETHDDLSYPNARCNAVVTPHNLSEPVDGRYPDAMALLRCGQYNFGYLHLNRRPSTISFLRWWGEKLLTRCLHDASLGIFTDQSWGSLITSFVPDVHVVHDPGFNAAYYNLMPGDVNKHGGRFHVGPFPLRLMHYSGLDLANPARLSAHSDRFNPIDPLVDFDLKLLVSDYIARVESVDERLGKPSSTPYSFSTHHDGTPVGKRDRRSFLALPDARKPSDPFEGHIFNPPPTSGFREAFVRRTWNLLSTLGPVAIYGAGKHTTWLHSIVRDETPSPLVTAILDDDPVRMCESFNLPTTRPDSYTGKLPFDVVLISTDVPANALRMMKRAHAYLPSAKIINLYDGCPPGQYV